MSGISSRRIRYGVGSSSNWTTYAMVEGLPLIEHVEPESVYDSTSGHVTTEGAKAGVDVDTFQLGAQYYIASPSIYFRAAHARRILDSYFSQTIVGGSPNYTRTYKLEDIEAIHSQKIFTFNKNTAKTGHDYTDFYAGGCITGITLSQSIGEPMRLDFRLALCKRAVIPSQAANAAWITNWTDGNLTLQRLFDMSFLFGDAGSPSSINITSWSVTLSHEFEPKFWSDDEADLIVRGKPSISGEFTLRDKTSEVEDIRDRIRAETPSRLVIIGTSALSVDINIKLHGGQGYEDDITRYGTIKFTGIRNPSGTNETPLLINLQPQRS